MAKIPFNYKMKNEKLQSKNTFGNDKRNLLTLSVFIFYHTFFCEIG